MTTAIPSKESVDARLAEAKTLDDGSVVVRKTCSHPAWVFDTSKPATDKGISSMQFLVFRAADATDRKEPYWAKIQPKPRYPSMRGYWNELVMTSIAGELGFGPLVYDAWQCPQKLRKDADTMAWMDKQWKSVDRWWDPVGMEKNPDTFWCMVMEKIPDAQTARDWLGRIERDFTDAYVYLLQLLHTAVDDMQDKGMQHGDLHLDNVLLLRNGQVKFVDFASSFYKGANKLEQKERTRDWYSVSDSFKSITKQHPDESKAAMAIVGLKDDSTWTETKPRRPKFSEPRASWFDRYASSSSSARERHRSRSRSPERRTPGSGISEALKDKTRTGARLCEQRMLLEDGASMHVFLSQDPRDRILSIVHCRDALFVLPGCTLPIETKKRVMDWARQLDTNIVWYLQ